MTMFSVCVCFQPPVDVVVSGPEVEVFDVELVKDNVGLGITIAGYISDKPNGIQLYLSLHKCTIACFTCPTAVGFFDTVICLVFHMDVIPFIGEPGIHLVRTMK